MSLSSLLVLLAVILLTLEAIGVRAPRASLGWLGLALWALAVLLQWENVNW